MDGHKSVVMTQRIYDYLSRFAEPPTTAQEKLISRTLELGDSSVMQIPHEQAAFLTILVKVQGASTVVEVGTYTGYSTLAFALGLPAHGRVITCDITAEWLDVAQEAWRSAQVADRIDFRLGPAVETLRALPAAADIDLAFIDADKVGYVDYWEELVPRIRPGGLLLADNVLYAGEAADDEPAGNAAAIDAFNQHVRADTRVESVLLPIADGLTIARKK